jgi:hypothetical protein
MHLGGDLLTRKVQEQPCQRCAQKVLPITFCDEELLSVRPRCKRWNKVRITRGKLRRRRGVGTQMPVAWSMIGITIAIDNLVWRDL